MFFFNPEEMFRPNQRPAMGTGKKIAAFVVGSAAVLGGCNGILAAAGKMRMTDPNKFTYAHDDAQYARLDLFGRSFFYSFESFTDADKLNAEGYKVIKDIQSYRPNAQLSDADRALIVSRLTAKGVTCAPDAISVTPVSRETTATTPSIGSTELTPLDVRICEDYGKVSLKGSNIVVPLTLRSLSDGPTQKIDETLRSDKCVKWGVKNQEIVNRDILSEMQSAGLPFQPGDQYPVIIHMNAENASLCDTDSPNTVVTER